MRVKNGFGVTAAGLLALLLSACQSTSTPNGNATAAVPTAQAANDPALIAGDPRLAGVAKELTGTWNGMASGGGGGRTFILVIDSVGMGNGTDRLKAKGYTGSERSAGARNPVDIDVAVTGSGYTIAFDARLGHVEAHSISRPGAMEGQVTTGRGRVDLTMVKASN